MSVLDFVEIYWLSFACLLCVFCFFVFRTSLLCSANLRFYTESGGPDPNMTPYYQSVPMAMWVTLLNLSGEAPLCDYTVWGKVGLAILYA